MIKLRARFINDEEATFQGQLFSDIMTDDIFAILEEANGPVTASDLTESLRGGFLCQYSAQEEKNHVWSFSSWDRIEDIAQDLGFRVERPKHRKTGKPLSRGWAIFI